MRARIDITEVEAATKIRAKYLRALENEEWDLLPGPTFVKTFLRTYADYLGLDSRCSSTSTSCRYERPRDAELLPFAPRPAARAARRSAAAAVRALGPILVVGASSSCCSPRSTRSASTGGGSDSTTRLGRSPRRRRRPRAKTPSSTQAAKRRRPAPQAAAPRAPACAAATGDVYVCLVNAERKPLDRRPDAARRRADADVYAAKRFRVTLGNDAVQMLVNGKAYEVAPSATPIGYELRSGHKPRRLLLRRSCADLRVSARAGIVVTGTEVLIGHHPGPQRAVAVRAPARAAASSSPTS